MVALQPRGELGARLRRRERLAHADRARRVLHVGDGPGILRVDLDGGVRGRGGRAADQERHLELQPLHLARHVHHLVQRRRDEAREPDHVGLLAARGLEDPLRRHHHAEVDDLEVVALEDDADDVLADVVDVALDGRDHDLAVGARRLARFLVQERHEVRDRLLHDARGFHDLRQEHLAGAEQVADHVHAVHQRPLDHRRAGGRTPRGRPPCPR